MTLQLRAHAEALIHCRVCRQAMVLCLTCGRHLATPPVFVGIVISTVCQCAAGVETHVLVDVVGHRPNPTGEAPPPAELSADLARLSRSWAKPAAARPAAQPAPPRWQPPWPARPATPKLPARPQRKRPRYRSARRASACRQITLPPPPAATPCPPGAVRLRHARWAELGIVPADVAPAAIAAAYRRRFGVSPHVDPTHRTFRVYSLRELQQSLAELRADPSAAPEG
ncbi:hypothetical protein [Vulcanococcus limneticus]|uniref:hypothetical protein n=1 Tax=Vulcanococcus limneticus TaxID=2170428 RepID=UPI00398BECAE